MVLQKRYFHPDWAGADILKYDIQYTWSANANETVRTPKSPLTCLICHSD